MYLISGNKAECCGCTACQQICGHSAITMTTDEDGFILPLKNLDLCTDCGLCEKVCPYTQLETHTECQPRAYACYVKERGQRMKSSSGGLFYAIASSIIEQGGIVYGAELDSEMQIHHSCAENLEDLEKLRGSKYVQSNLLGTYREIRKQLKSGRLVYFTGVGCQVAGLRSFLMRDYDNLITSDLVCHGTPNQQLFDKHIHYLEKKHNGKVVDYQFRDNAAWGGCESVTIVTDSQTRKVYRLPSYTLSPFLYSFMYAMTYRLSCYECPFAKIPRQGDITLADFWGVKTYFPNIDASTGVSLILTNSAKGEQILSKIREKLHIIESTVDEAGAFNKNLLTHTAKPEIRNNIFQIIREEGYQTVAKTYFRPKDYQKRIFNLYVSKLKAFVKKLVRK